MRAHGTTQSATTRIPANVIEFDEVCRRRYQRLAREFLRWPIWRRFEEGTATPANEALVAGLIKRGSGYDFVASSRLTDIQLKVAAYYLAVRTTKGQEVDGMTTSNFAHAYWLMSRLARRSGIDRQSYIDFRCLGAVQLSRSA